MRRPILSNLTLIAVGASYFVQIGAGFFALAVIGRVMSAAPPRSLAMLEGAYRYDSSGFWQIAPAITGVLFLSALIANWKTKRRALLIGSFIIFLIGGLVTTMWLAPYFADIVAGGYRDLVDPELQRRAAIWYAADWAIRFCEAVAGVLLLVALTRTTTE